MSRLLNLLRASKDVRKAQLMSRAELLQLQERRWRAMARYALEVSPFYRRHLAGIDVERCPITDIPPLTKDLLLANWDEIVSDPRLRRAALEAFLKEPKNWGTLLHGRWMVSTTSGTTGAAMAMPHDIAAVDRVHACGSVRHSASPRSATEPRPSLLRRRSKVVAFVTTASPSISAAMYATRPWISTLLARYHLINVTAPWSQVLAEVQHIQPDVMAASASLLGRLAQAQLNGELSIRMPQDRGYLSAGGDATTPGIRDLCLRAFGIEPFSTYGTGETLGIARHWQGVPHMLCHDDMVVFEAVDAAGRTVPEGVLSDHALATPLIDRAVPLLRYRINDRVKIGPVEAHWPFRSIEQLIGRSTACYAFKAPGPSVFMGAHFLFLMEERQDVALFQFRQTSMDAVECLVVPKPGVDAGWLQQDLEAQMRRCLEVGGCAGVKGSARLVSELLPDARTGKVEQNVPMKDELE